MCRNEPCNQIVRYRRSALVMVLAASSNIETATFHLKQIQVDNCEDYQGFLYELSLNNASYKTSDRIILNVYFNNNFEFIEQL